MLRITPFPGKVSGVRLKSGCLAEYLAVFITVLEGYIRETSRSKAIGYKKIFKKRHYINMA